MKTQLPGNPVYEFKKIEDGIKFECIHLVSEHDVLEFAELQRQVTAERELVLDDEGRPVGSRLKVVE